MLNLDFSKRLVLGGLRNYNKEAIDLRSIQINEGLKIHTCNNYRQSLEVIKTASKGIENKVKIITKVYYKYPDINHNRFRPMIDQIDEIAERLSFIPKDWSIQICSYCHPKDLTKENAVNFFYKIKKDYNISQVFLETYPIYNYELKDINLVNKFYKKEILFGFAAYQNLGNRIFSDKELNKFSSNSIPLYFIGVLGKGKTNQIKYSSDQLNTISHDEILNINLIYFIKNILINNLTKGITQVNSRKNYYDLKNKYNYLKELLLNKDLSNYIITNNNSKKYFFNNFDQYGAKYAIKSYIKNPKLLASKIKRRILLLNNKSYNFRNFWS